MLSFSHARSALLHRFFLYAKVVADSGDEYIIIPPRWNEATNILIDFPIQLSLFFTSQHFHVPFHPFYDRMHRSLSPSDSNRWDSHAFDKVEVIVCMRHKPAKAMNFKFILLMAKQKVAGSKIDGNNDEILCIWKKWTEKYILSRLTFCSKKK